MPLRYFDPEQANRKFGKQRAFQLVDDFLEDSPRLLQRIQHAYFKGDRQQLSRLAEATGAKLRELCAEPLAKLAWELAHSARHGSDFELKDHVLKFLGCLRFLCMEMEQQECPPGREPHPVTMPFP